MGEWMKFLAEAGAAAIISGFAFFVMLKVINRVLDEAKIEREEHRVERREDSKRVQNALKDLVDELRALHRRHSDNP